MYHRLLYGHHFCIIKGTAIDNKQKHLACKTVAWARKTAATKRTDIGVWPSLMQYQYILG